MIALKCIVITIFLIMSLVSCSEKNSGLNETNSIESSLTSNIQLNSSNSSESSNPYNTMEISRNTNYKTMQMKVYDGKGICSRKITFEIPVTWRGDASVFTNGEDYKFTLKVDMWDITNATRADVMNEYKESKKSFEIIDEKIYPTENYEIFKYKYCNKTGEASFIYVYYLYANGERFCISSFVFGEDKPEYNDIVNRIVESVKFQF